MNQKIYRKKKTNRKNKTNKRNKKYTNIRNKNKTKRYNKRVYSNRKINKKINKRIYSNRKSLYDLYTGGSISVVHQQGVSQLASVERVYVYKKQRDSNMGPNRSKRGSYHIREFRFFKFKGNLFFTFTKPTIALISTKKTNKRKSPFKNVSGPYVLIRIEMIENGKYTLYYIGKGKYPVLHNLEICTEGSSTWSEKIGKEDHGIREMLMQNAVLLKTNNFWETLENNMLQQYRIIKKENITHNMIIGLGGLPTNHDKHRNQTYGEYGVKPQQGTSCFPYIPKESSFYYLNESGGKETVFNEIDEIQAEYLEYLENRWASYFLPVIKLDQDANHNPVPKFGAIIYYYTREGISKIYKFLHFNYNPTPSAQSEWPEHFRNELGDSAGIQTVQLSMDNIVNNLCTNRDDRFAISYDYLVDTSNLNKNTLIPNFLKVIPQNTLKYYIISIYYVICIFFILKGISKIKDDLDLDQSLNYYGVHPENVNFRSGKFYHIIGFKNDQKFPNMFSKNKRLLTPEPFDASLGTIEEDVDDSEYESEDEIEEPNESQLLEPIERHSEEDNEVVGPFISPPADDEPDSPTEEHISETSELLPQVISHSGRVTDVTVRKLMREGRYTPSITNVGTANTQNAFNSSSKRINRRLPYI